MHKAGFFHAVILAFGLVYGSTVASACQGTENCARGLAFEAFGPRSTAGQPVLAVFLHGDIPAGGPADVMLDPAKNFAASRPNVVAVSLLRPGYYDKAGRRSEGSDGARRETFTATNNNMVAIAIAELKDRYKAKKVVVLGHDGGAATAAVLLGSHPGLINGAVLVGCPCDVASWRPGKGGALQTPLDVADRIPTGTQIVAVNGDRDTETRPFLADTFIARAKAKGAIASSRQAKGDHLFTGSVAGTATAALGSMAQ